DPIKVATRSYVEDRALIAPSEANISGQYCRGDSRQLLALRSVHIDAWTADSPYRHIEISFAIGDQTIRSILRSIVNQGLAKLGCPVGIQIVSQQCHTPLVQRSSGWDSKHPGSAVLVGNDVKRFLIGRYTNTIRLSGIGNDSVKRTIRIDSVDSHHGLFDRLIPEIAGITEV